MAPMQWHDATVSGGTLTARQEPDVSQVIGQFGQFDQTSYGFEALGNEKHGFEALAGQGLDLVEEFDAATPLPVGLDLPCTEDPELFFAESPSDVEQAKAMCWGCRARLACLTGALERREPWGVWGGELLMRGAVVPRKRPRGRPRKSENTSESTEVAA
jgi:WhiB family transcriptional regulator, redox-sensing transcriptional regulator